MANAARLYTVALSRTHKAANIGDSILEKKIIYIFRNQHCTANDYTQYYTRMTHFVRCHSTSRLINWFYDSVDERLRRALAHVAHGARFEFSLETAAGSKAVWY